MKKKTKALFLPQSLPLEVDSYMCQVKSLKKELRRNHSFAFPFLDGFLYQHVHTGPFFTAEGFHCVDVS